ncbi:hypothetical protein [Sporosarcina sp. G11-34]|uniref:hypothetical protein n=1 Tax=Sporosarcina sp. G11-34 TaxID=2849605 RepID=UPI0022A94CC1|nr:hypothetical protein [Sporosarcina sp. G11-34]MCZ2256946.1 hypothetical protein [Sporosarcina sp. G11-34]
MNQQVFKQSLVGGVVLSVAILGVFIFFYFGQGNISPMLFLILLLPVLFIFGLLKTKLVIEDGVLRYVKIIGDEEIALINVAQIVTREIEVITTTSRADNHNQNQNQGLSFRSGQQAVNQERSTQKVIYVMDDAGGTFFSFPASFITRKDRQRFQEAVTAVNPNIEVFL